MTRVSSIRLAEQTDEVTSLLRVVNLVRTGDANTRPEIARVTGLGRGAVAQRIDQAIELGLLVDGEVAASSGGRAPRTLRFRSERGRILVCMLGAFHIHVGYADLGGDVIADLHDEWDITQGPARTLRRAMELIDQLLAEADDTPLWAISVGVPGPVNFETGTPVAPPIMPGWNGFDIRGAFQDRYHAAVWVDNGVNILALGERVRLSAPALDLVYCKVGTGIAAAFLSRGRIHRGADGAAGDIGHVTVPDSAGTCRCGRIGCLDAVASGWALVQATHVGVQAGATGPLANRVATGERITPLDISIAADEGDPLAVSLIQRSARAVGASLAMLVNMFNPRTIVIGGVLAGAGELFLAEVRQRVFQLALPLATRELSIIRSANDPREPLRGGLELAREQLFDVTFPRWIGEGRPTADRVNQPTAA